MDLSSKRANLIENITSKPENSSINLEKQEAYCPPIHSDSTCEGNLSQSLQTLAISTNDSTNSSRESVKCLNQSETPHLENWTLKFMDALGVKKEMLYESLMKMLKSFSDNISINHFQFEKRTKVEEDKKDEEDGEDEEEEEKEEDKDIKINRRVIDPNFPTGEAYNHFISQIDWDTITSEEENNIYEQRMLQIRRDNFFSNEGDISLSLVKIVTTIKMNIWLELDEEIPNFNVPRFCPLRNYIDEYSNEIYQFIGCWNISIEDLKQVLLLARKLRLTPTSLCIVPQREIYLYANRMNDLQNQAYRILKTFIDYYPCSYNKNVTK